MAKLSSYYTLCPLIDQQNLLGVQKDSDPGCAIVTLGRNIVIRYKVRFCLSINQLKTIIHSLILFYSIDWFCRELYAFKT